MPRFFTLSGIKNVLLIVFIFLLGANLHAQTIQVYSSSGIFTVPACVTTITVQCWGAGGGGGGASEASGGAAGSGGGGGGFATATLTNVSGTYTVTVGTGGTQGIGSSSTATDGGPGGSSIFSNGTVTVTGIGGTGGKGSTGGVGTTFGIGGGGSFAGATGTTYKGGNGALGNNQDNNTGGAGGGGAGNAGNGTTPNQTGNDANATGGAGGPGSPNTAQYEGGVGGGVSAAYYENGNNGITLGGGGAGGGGETSGGLFGHGTSPGNGGAGGDGQVIISYNLATPTITSVTGNGCTGTTITINGTLLTGATSVTIGNTPVTNLSVTSTIITGTVANGTTTGTVKVITPCGTATSSSPFTVNAAPAPVNSGTHSLCTGAYSFGGHSYSSAGTYYDTTSSTITGCDSITSVTLTGGVTVNQSISRTICAGGTYSFGGHLYNSTGTYADTSTAASGCDSITTLNLLVDAVLYRAVSWTICPGGSYSFNGSSYSAAGTYVDTLRGAGANGCDSISALILSVLPSPTSTIHASFCNQLGYTLNGVTYTSPGNYADTIVGAGANGCDSIVVLQLSQNSDSVSAYAVQPTFCAGDSTQLCATAGFASYHWTHGDSTACIYTTTPGNYLVTVTDRHGCTGVSNQVSVSQFPATNPATIHASGDTLYTQVFSHYQWYLNNQVLNADTGISILATQPGNYTVDVSDSNGCSNISSAYLLATGIHEADGEAEMKVYPNPLTIGNWMVHVSDRLVGSACEILDADGRIVFRSILTGNHNVINPAIAKGVYYMQIRTAVSTYQLKLVKLD